SLRSALLSGAAPGCRTLRSLKASLKYGRSGARRPGAERFYEAADGRALSAANIIAAGRDAHQNTRRVLETEKFSQTESGVEVVSGAGSNERFLHVRAIDERDFTSTDGQRIGHRMHHQRIDRH